LKALRGRGTLVDCRFEHSTPRLMLLGCETAPRGFHVRSSGHYWSRYLLLEAVTFAVEALSGLPIELRPDNNIADMKRLVEEFVKHDAGLAHSQMIARRRLGYVLAYGKTNGT
jgi:hypothetical protein